MIGYKNSGIYFSVLWNVLSIDISEKFHSLLDHNLQTHHINSLEEVYQAIVSLVLVFVQICRTYAAWIKTFALRIRIVRYNYGVPLLEILSVIFNLSTFASNTLYINLLTNLRTVITYSLFWFYDVGSLFFCCITSFYVYMT